MLWFITPAHGRYEITRHTLAQRAKLCKRIGARCVVIAEDENLEIARLLGLDTLPMENRFLGQRFNAGVKYALDKGATHITLFDSDSITMDCLYNDLSDEVTFHPNYSFVLPNGKRAEIKHQRWVQTIWPAEWMELVEGTPCDRFINRHVTSTMLRNISQAAKGYDKPLTPRLVQKHKLEQVGFQGEDNISWWMAILFSSSIGNWASDVWEPVFEAYKEDHNQILGLKDYYERIQIG